MCPQTPEPPTPARLGWVARAWLAEGCSSADRENVLSLTTLGTPNTGPKEEDAGAWTSVDQTRGLLKNINARFPGAHVEGVRYTSVAGTALEGEAEERVEGSAAVELSCETGGSSRFACLSRWTVDCASPGGRSERGGREILRAFETKFQLAEDYC